MFSLTLFNLKIEKISSFSLMHTNWLQSLTLRHQLPHRPWLLLIHNPLTQQTWCYWHKFSPTLITCLLKKIDLTPTPHAKHITLRFRWVSIIFCFDAWCGRYILIVQSLRNWLVVGARLDDAELFESYLYRLFGVSVFAEGDYAIGLQRCSFGY